MEIRHRGRLIPVTMGEFRLIRFFLLNPHVVLSREKLLEVVKAKERKGITNRTIDNYILRLRKKLHPSIFTTVQGIGYKFNPRI